MGARGPAPKPTRLRLLDGSGKQHPERINKGEPQPKDALPEPPEWLEGEREREAYQEVAGKLSDMRLLTEADQHATAQLAIYWVKWKELAETAETDVTVTEKGYAMADPRINSMVKIGEKVTQLLKEFGMTPSARTRISTPEEEPVDPVGEWLSNAN